MELTVAVMKVCVELLTRRIFVISWISLVVYMFYDTFTFYMNGRQFFYLREILGVGLCTSRGTATVLNLCCALVLLPLCKKLNLILSRILCSVWPGLFFFWLERAKSIHMTVAVTLILFAVIHSISHLANLWNFSRGYNDELPEINFASYKNESLLRLLMSQAGLTGVLMMIITICMGLTSLRAVRRKIYNAFWYTHQLYIVFMVLLLIHPLSGALKEEVLENHETSPIVSNLDNLQYNYTTSNPKFVAIKSKEYQVEVDEVITFLAKKHESAENKEANRFAFVYTGSLHQKLWRRYNTVSEEALDIVNSHKQGSTHFARNQKAFLPDETWLWMSLPLSCFFIDLIWRVCSRNRAHVEILEATHMPGHTMNLKMTLPNSEFRCEKGQYVLLQCLDISLLEWHPFSVVQMPTKKNQEFSVWIRVKGDWTIMLEKNIHERGPGNLRMIVDGPFSSPMEGVSRSDVAICVAAGVGITPFVSVLQDLLEKPRRKHPGRLHLLWIVRYESEIKWLADLAHKCILQLRNYNRLDRLQLEFYVTKRNKDITNTSTHMVVLNDKGVQNIIRTYNDTKTLLTPNRRRNNYTDIVNVEKGIVDDNNYDVANEYPILGCRIKRGRPHWDRVFGYWINLYPEKQLNLYCCGPKNLVKLLRRKCREVSMFSNTNISFIHEGFS